MFEPDESKLIRKGVLVAPALVSTESARYPVRVITLIPDPVQLYRDENFGEIFQAEEAGTGIGERTYGESWERYIDNCRGNNSSAPGGRPERSKGSIRTD